MKTTFHCGKLVLGLLAGLLSVASFAAAEPALPLALDSLEFTAPTNIKAVTVHGKSTEMKGTAAFDKGALSKVDATVTIDSLKTGMEMRDHHMREKIFKKADGSFPDLHFSSSSVTCSGASCTVKGPLSIRGVAKDGTFVCNVVGKTSADCTATVKLSDYGIERPTQLGVTVTDEVAIKLTVKQAGQ